MSVTLATRKASTAFPKGVEHWMTYSVVNGSLADATYSSCLDATEGVLYLTRWNVMESSPGVFDFSSIISALNYVHARGKKLILRIYFKSYDASWLEPVPQDIVADHTTYGGTVGFGGMLVNTFTGYTANFANRKVFNRYLSMLSAMGAVLGKHPALFGVAPDESAWSISGLPEGLLAEGLIDIYWEHLEHLRRTFPEALVFPYVNYLEGSTTARIQEVFRETLTKGYPASLTDIFRVPEQAARVQPVAAVYPVSAFTLASIDSLSYGDDDGPEILRERQLENCRHAAYMGANIIAWNTKGGYSGNYWQAALHAMATVR